MTRLSIRRRTMLTLLASASALSVLGLPPVKAEDAAGINFIIMADLHSAYDRTGQLLAAVESQIAASHLPSIIIINGDLFEKGNVVADRSNGEIDWAFLKALTEEAPVVFNIGNHEPDFDTDLANFVTRAQKLGVTVLTNITDSRTGKLYAPASATLDINGQPVTFAAIGVDNLFTYPEATRDQISVPEPVKWARENLGQLLQAGHVNIVLSHAGVVPDKAILPLLPDGTLMVGGHDHLNIEHKEGNSRYLHTGCWSTACTLANIAEPGKVAVFTRIDIDADAAPSEKLADLIPAVMAIHLTDEDTEIVGYTNEAMTNDETGLFVAAALARAAGGDIGFIGHTTFGAGLPKGPVSRYVFASSLRFDGGLKKAEVDTETLKAILQRCNQFGAFPFVDRTGDYLYAAPDVKDRKIITIVCNGWSAMNAESYFGRNDMAFSDVPDLQVREVALAALK